MVEQTFEKMDDLAKFPWLTGTAVHVALLAKQIRGSTKFPPKSMSRPGLGEMTVMASRVSCFLVQYHVHACSFRGLRDTQKFCIQPRNISTIVPHNLRKIEWRSRQKKKNHTHNVQKTKTMDKTSAKKMSTLWEKKKSRKILIF